MIKKPLTWILTFAIIFSSAVVYLFSIKEVSLGPMGIPNWVYGFLLIELFYCLAIYVFVTRYWQNDETSR